MKLDLKKNRSAITSILVLALAVIAGVALFSAPVAAQAGYAPVPEPDVDPEDNDDPSGAETIDSGEYGAEIGPQPDYFAINLTRSEIIEVGLEFDNSEANIDAEFLDSSLSVIDSGTSSTDDESINASPSTGGTYYLRTYRVGSGSNSSYNINVNTIDIDPEPDNNDPRGLEAISDGTYQAKIAGTYEDNFAVDITPGERIEAEVEFEHGEGNIDAELLDSSFNVINSSTSTTDNESVSASPSTGGTYYLRTYRSDQESSPMKYNFTINTSNQSAGSPDDGNDTAQSGEFVDVDATDLAGAGTEEDPYMITNASELQAMEDSLDSHYELGNEIDASATAQWNSGAGFAPVGNDSAEFTGSFDGDQYNITNLTINRTSTNNIGLFGKVSKSAVVESVHVNSATVVGNDNVGAVVGYVDEKSTVRSVSVNGSITGNFAVGGVVGVVRGGSMVQDVSSKGSMDGSDKVGGVVGENSGSVVTRSYSKATVTAKGDGFSARTGGLVGGNFNDGVINQSYATGVVDGGDAGGITGVNYDNSRIANVYAAGSVTGRSESSTGGITGVNRQNCPFQSQQQCEDFESSTVTDSYWDTEATGQSTSAGDAVGLTTAEMTGSAAETNMAEFEFGSIWQTQPDGYPILVQQADDKSDQSGSAQVQLSSVTLTPQSVDSASESTHQLSFEAQNISADGSEDEFDITFPDKVELVDYSHVEIDEKSSDVNKVDNTLEFSVDPTGGGSTQISGELNVTVSATN